MAEEKVIAVSCGQRSRFPKADAVWFLDGTTFISANELGQMWKHRIGITSNHVELGIKKKEYRQSDFIDVFTGHLSGRFAFTHRIFNREEADLVIKENDLREIT